MTLNATQAAIRAGYSVNRASEIGYQLLRKTTVSDAIAKAMAERSKRIGITADRVLNVLAKIVFTNSSDFAKVVDKPIIQDGKYVMDPDTGKVKTYKTVDIIPTDSLLEDKRKAIASIKEGKYGIKSQPVTRLRLLNFLAGI